MNQRKFSAAQLKKLDAIEQVAIAKFTGDLGELESALGMLRLGQQYGWRVMYLIHSKATIRKYEKILDIDVKELFPEAGPSAERNQGYKLIQKVGNFWKVVSGENKVANKRLTK
ncbi:hypothetical protein N8559_07980 [Gammaproteobacteria bacterium]|nr:hypothetical protein [Gammaproteobacteria bacterium]